MLNLDTLDQSIGSISCTIKGTEITFHYRQASHPEVVSVRYQTVRLAQKIQNAQQAVTDGEEPSEYVSADDVEVLIRFIDKVVTDVEGTDADWPNVPTDRRLALFRMMPESAFWDIINNAVAGLPNEVKGKSEGTSQDDT